MIAIYKIVTKKGVFDAGDSIHESALSKDDAERLIELGIVKDEKPAKKTRKKKSDE